MRWKRWRPRFSRYVNTSRVRLRRVNTRFARSTEPEMLVLDAGAGVALLPPHADLGLLVRQLFPIGHEFGIQAM